MNVSISLIFFVAGLVLVLLALRAMTRATVGRALDEELKGVGGSVLRGGALGQPAAVSSQPAGNVEPGDDEVEQRRRLERLWLHPLSEEARQAFAARWQRVAEFFAETPRYAVGEAQALAEEVLLARGYPVDDWEWLQVGMKLVRPDMVDHFDKARQIAAKNRMTRATDGDLARAREHYQALFEGLVTHAEPTAAQPAAAPAQPAEAPAQPIADVSPEPPEVTAPQRGAVESEQPAALQAEVQSEKELPSS